jgi:hypothetical protein
VFLCADFASFASFAVKCNARDHGTVARHRKGRKGREVKAKEHSACELMAADELIANVLTAGGS